MHLAQNRAQWWGSCENSNEPTGSIQVVVGISRLVEQPTASQEGLCSMELLNLAS